MYYVLFLFHTGQRRPLAEVTKELINLLKEESKSAHAQLNEDDKFELMNLLKNNC